MTRRVLGSALVVAALAGAGLLLAWQLPRPVSEHSAIGRLWHQNADRLGPAWNPESCTGAVCVQDFRAGSIYSTEAGFARIVHDDAVGATFDELGGVSTLGPPIAAERGPRGRPWQAFVHAGIFAGGSDAPVLVRGDLWKSWLRYADERGGLGVPRADEYRDRRGTLTQDFVNGAIYVRSGQAIPTVADIASVHRDTGAQFGPLGYPTGTQRAVGDRLVQEFDGGEVWWSAGTGAASVTEPFLQAFRDRGGAVGTLGLPIGEARRVGDGSMQQFQGGALYRSGEGGIRATTTGEIQNRYEELGGAGGVLGLPVGEKVDIAGGRYQVFAGGVLLWHSGGGVVLLDKGNFGIWSADTARFGWPAKDGWTDERGAHMVWQKGATVLRDSRLLSVEAAEVGASTALLICDSQCSGNSWIDQGARDAGFTDIVKRGYPGSGYVAPISGLGLGVVEAVSRNAILLPEGNPGVIIVTLGGNDVAHGVPAASVTTALDGLVGMLRQTYPDTPIVIDGVMSRRDPGHAGRRAMDATVTAEAARLGCLPISVSGWVSDYSAPQADNVHLTPAGAAKIAPYYADALRAALGR